MIGQTPPRGREKSDTVLKKGIMYTEVIPEINQKSHDVTRSMWPEHVLDVSRMLTCILVTQDICLSDFVYQLVDWRFGA